jgi:hypothetical protein
MAKRPPNRFEDQEMSIRRVAAARIVESRVSNQVAFSLILLVTKRRKIPGKRAA